MIRMSSLEGREGWMIRMIRFANGMIGMNSFGIGMNRMKTMRFQDEWDGFPGGNGWLDD